MLDLARTIPRILARTTLILGLGALSAAPACGGKEGEGAAEDGEQIAAAQVGDVVAEVTAVRGPGGLSEKGGAAGTFLGAGASLTAGTSYVVPRGSMVELRLANGGVIRANEDCVLALGAGDAPAVRVESGEIVVLALASSGVRVAAGKDVLRLAHGEARIVADGEDNHYAVVHGDAELETDGERLPLGPGAQISTPLKDPSAARPVVSLKPLEQTAWSRAFEAAAQMAAQVPRGVGSLTARRPGSSAQRQALSLVDQQVHVSISGRIARTEIQQTFRNNQGEVLEGIYRFPIPADASISGLQLLVGNRWMDGEMLEKQRAKSIFQQIVDATIPRDPALLHWEHGNVFKLRIFPIPGRGERKIRLAYTQILPAVGDTLRYRYPLGGSGTGATGNTIENFAFTVRVDKGALDSSRRDNLKTPMLPLERREEGDAVVLSTSRQGFVPAYDVGVDLPVPEGPFAQAHLDGDGQAYFMTVFEPEMNATSTKRHMTDYVIIFDRSHGTTPELWTAARGLWGVLAQTIGNGDRVAVLACDTACDVAPGALAAVNGSRVSQIDGFLNGQVLAGASDVGNMVTHAADILQGSDAQRVILYLGDGAPTSGELAADKLVERVADDLRDVRFEAVALGARADMLTLNALARAGGGGVLLADARDDLRGVAQELILRASVPVARDVELELPPGMVAVHPRGKISVRAGEPITLVGKLSQPVDGAIRVRGRMDNGDTFEDRVDVRLDAQRDPLGQNLHLPRTWAQEQIAFLTSTAGHDARAEIVELSQEYTVLSRYTALLVLENDAMYREFGVRRRARNKDAWNGSFNEAPSAGSTPTGQANLHRSPARQAGATATAEAEPSPDAAVPPAPAIAEDEAKLEAGKSDGAGASRDEWFDDSIGGADADASTRAQDQKEAEEASGDEVVSELFDGEVDEPDAPSKTAGTSAPRPKATKKKRAVAPTPSKPASRPAEEKNADRYDNDPLDGVGGGSPGRGGAWGSGGMIARPRPMPRVRVSEASAPSARTMDKIARLRAARDATPTLRSAHRRLVRTAIAAGHPDALRYAQEWAQADPEHAPALRAVADMLSATGDAHALRAYASAVEVSPFSKQAHTRLAMALENKGDVRRSCSHRLALVSIDPAVADHHVQLGRCLARDGRTDDARAALQAGQKRSLLRNLGLDSLWTAIDRGGPFTPSISLHSRPDLRATLEWSGGADLDVVIVDPRGQRLGPSSPEKIRVIDGPGRDELTLRRLRSTHFVEVTRADSGTDPVRATLRIRTNGTTRTFPVEISRASVRVARLTYRR